uniref:Dolichol-phosphate mannosyltransferase subunit 3 n=1 Tax=Cucumis melo TaxID=3656 RepID=A0A9I9E1U3_CUCME
MKHIVKILTLLVAISALWIGLLQTSILPHGHTWLLPIYFIVSLGCYGLLMVGVGLMTFPTCPAEGLLLQKVLLPFYSHLHFRVIQQRTPSSLSLPFFSGMFSKFPYPRYY